MSRGDTSFLFLKTDYAYSFQETEKIISKNFMSNQDKNFGQTRLEGHSTKFLTGAPCNCEDHQKEGTSETLGPEEPTET